MSKNKIIELGSDLINFYDMFSDIDESGEEILLCILSERLEKIIRKKKNTRKKVEKIPQAVFEDIKLKTKLENLILTGVPYNEIRKYLNANRYDIKKSQIEYYYLCNLCVSPSKEEIEAVSFTKKNIVKIYSILDQRSKYEVIEYLSNARKVSIKIKNKKVNEQSIKINHS